ncbi:AAA family ATPase [Skermania sp. ID1734]|uniref:MobF family relaxase n=1 Tax=Skermania sp. ID1734 TaxID=2597516 RepID=UPI001180B3FF|nr:MobF family relaxase [Skermania sp. ID1734]TSD93751.1 AAA family ATPase [Skermania sp. ID1734]
MTVHRLHAGDGYTYLTRQVATADREREPGEKIVDYYTAHGTPPGHWWGHGASEMGVEGQQVSEEQMLALFGEGLHPDADAIIARELAAGKPVKDAVAAAKLGASFAHYDTGSSAIATRLAAKISAFTATHRRLPTQVERAVLRTDAAREYLQHTTDMRPSAEAINDALAEEKRHGRAAVAGFDCVFTPQKSISLLWGLGSVQVRETIERCHAEAVRESLELMQKEVAKTRRGKAGVKQIDATGLAVTLFDHYDNRAGDPNLHTHAAVSNKVRGVDGKWTALDGRVLYQYNVALSCHYNTAITDKVARELGVRFTPRDTGPGKQPVLEVDGITPAMIAEFSRHGDIVARTRDLAENYRATHGHSPSKPALYKLAQQATLDTRDGKPPARPLGEMRTDWATRFTKRFGTTGRSAAQFVDDLITGHRRQAGEVRVYRPGRDHDTVASEVLAAAAQRRATWGESHLRSHAETILAGYRFDSDTARNAAADEVIDTARARCLRLSVDPGGLAPETARRADGASIYTVHGTTRYTTDTVLETENRLREAAHTPTALFATGSQVDVAIAAVEKETGRTLNPGQRDMVRHLCCSGQLLTVAVGPAGSGKTTALRAAKQAWAHTSGDVVALAPSAAAARVLGDELGLTGYTLDKVLTLAAAGGQHPITPGALVIVDEAGMAATTKLDQLLTLARQVGANIAWVGDPYQLGAVESGGAMRLIARDTRAPELAHVVRFRDADEADASLAVRDGDAEKAWAFYTDRDRVRAGLGEHMRDQILADHLTDLDAGRVSVMLAATVDDVRALNEAAQAAHTLSGNLDPHGPAVTLVDGLSARAGDQIVTRKNNSRCRILGGKRAGTGIDNGDLWTVEKVHDDGSVTARGRSHRGTVHLPTDYLSAHTELGYAATIHRAQGLTVDVARVLIADHLGRSLAYVGLTRGAHANVMYLATDTLTELLDEQPPAPDTPADPQRLFTQVLARDDGNLTATETLRAELAHTDDPARLRAIHHDLHTQLATGRARYLLDRALPVAVIAGITVSPHQHDLLATIAAVGHAGLDTGMLVADITSRPADAFPGSSLLDSRDPAAVLRARADNWIATAVGRDPENFRALRDLPTPDLPPAPPRWPGTGTDAHDYTDRLAVRIRDLEHAASDPARAFVDAVHRDPALADAVDHTAAALRADGLDPARCCDNPAGILTGAGGHWTTVLANLRRAQDSVQNARAQLDAARAAHSTAAEDYRRALTDQLTGPAARRAEPAAAGYIARLRAALDSARAQLGAAEHAHRAATATAADALRAAAHQPTVITPAGTGTDATLAELVTVYIQARNLAEQARLARDVTATAGSQLAARLTDDRVWPRLREHLHQAEIRGLAVPDVLAPVLHDTAGNEIAAATITEKIEQRLDRDALAASAWAQTHRATIREQLGDDLADDPARWERLAIALRRLDRDGHDIDEQIARLHRQQQLRHLDSDATLTRAENTAYRSAPPPGAPVWIDPPIPGRGHDDPDLAAWIDQQYQHIHARAAEVARQARDTQADWTALLGNRPVDPLSGARWDHTLTQIAAYRDEFAVTDPASLLGPEPAPDHPAAAPYRQLRELADTLAGDLTRDLARMAADTPAPDTPGHDQPRPEPHRPPPPVPHIDHPRDRPGIDAPGW